MANSTLISYYTVKRVFLFLDELQFYLFIYLLTCSGFYSLIVPVMLYGFFCLYTSYSNIDKIEAKILDVKQHIYKPLDYLIHFANNVVYGICSILLWKFMSV